MTSSRCRSRIRRRLARTWFGSCLVGIVVIWSAAPSTSHARDMTDRTGVGGTVEVDGPSTRAGGLNFRYWFNELGVDARLNFDVLEQATGRDASDLGFGFHVLYSLARTDATNFYFDLGVSFHVTNFDLNKTGTIISAAMGIEHFFTDEFAIEAYIGANFGVSGRVKDVGQLGSVGVGFHYYFPVIDEDEPGTRDAVSRFGLGGQLILDPRLAGPSGALSARYWFDGVALEGRGSISTLATAEEESELQFGFGIAGLVALARAEATNLYLGFGATYRTLDTGLLLDARLGVEHFITDFLAVEGFVSAQVGVTQESLGRADVGAIGAGFHFYFN